MRIFKNQFKLFIRFFKIALAYRKRWAIVFLLSALSALLSIVNPYLTKMVVDDGITRKNLKTFILVILIGGGVFLVGEALRMAKEFYERYLKIKLSFDLNKKIFSHIQRLSFGWFSDRATGEHLYTIDYDINVVGDFIGSVLSESLFLFPKLLLILAMLFYLNYEMAIFSLCLLPFLYLPHYFFFKKTARSCDEWITHSEGIFKSLTESFSHMQLIKVFGKETQAIRAYLKMLIANFRLRLKNIKLEIYGSFSSELASRIVIGLIIVYGGYQVIGARLTLGAFTAIMVYLYQLVGLQSGFASFFQNTAVGMLSCRRIAEILDQVPQVREQDNARAVKFSKGEILFKNASFGYNSGAYVLKDLSFIIENDKHIALVGFSGCGKTTLLNLMARLYDPWQGEVLIDGEDIRNLKFTSLKEQIGFVLQEPFLWNCSIENNIRYARDAAGFDDMEFAAKLCGVDEIAKNLNDGYKTVVGENACKLSEGQKQKIAIARALIKAPKILILDEAMSSMDSAGEDKIIVNIKNSLPAVTLISVSHRLSTVMKADLVYYLASPSQMIIGKPRDLFRQNEELKRLFGGQEGISLI